MTVKQLIKRLSTLEPNALVILQCDSEGNGYSPLVDAEACTYRPDSTWSGQTVDGEDYEPEPNDCKAVVLWPVN